MCVKVIAFQRCSLFFLPHSVCIVTHITVAAFCLELHAVYLSIVDCRFQLIKNVSCVFTKFVSEGKCTIRLCEPPVDIAVSKVNKYF